jgi:hypothetical protein
MVGLATLLFLSVVFYGHETFGWTPGNSQIQMALCLTFALGIISGLKLRA